MKEHLQSIATLFSLINPMVCAMMFASLAAGQTGAQRASGAVRAIAVIAVVLVIAAFAGAHILSLFGISLDVFSVAGGVVLSFIGFRMLAGAGTSHQTETSTPAKGPSSSNISYAPMILFAASPGTITGVITVAVAHSKDAIPVTALVGIAVVLTVTLALLLLVSRNSNPDQSESPGLARDMIGRYMGLIVVAMGIQFILTGYKAFMAV